MTTRATLWFWVSYCHKKLLKHPSPIVSRDHPFYSNNENLWVSGAVLLNIVVIVVEVRFQRIFSIIVHIATPISIPSLVLPVERSYIVTIGISWPE
jgi:hypothetical protein